MIIALNNKSNFTKELYISYTEQLEKLSFNSELILCPISLNIPLTNLNNVKLGSQNVSNYNEGAYTGEITAKQLKSFSVKYCIVGHSERRLYQKETNEDINEKIKRLIEEDIIPILCVGETKEERSNNSYLDIIKEEITIALKDISKEYQEKIIIAYEPIWSIGTGTTPSNNQIKEIVNYIKELVNNSKVLYGGSVDLNSINSLKSINEIDGFLLGGISLNVEKLGKLLEIVK